MMFIPCGAKLCQAMPSPAAQRPCLKASNLLGAMDSASMSLSNRCEIAGAKGHQL